MEIFYIRLLKRQKIYDPHNINFNSLLAGMEWNSF